MTWKIDDKRTRLEFSVRHMMISTVVGTFANYEATLNIDPERLETSSAQAKILARSIQTKDRLRDEYLRGDFLAPQKYPHLLFESTDVSVRGRKITVRGTLTIRDVARPLVLSGTVAGPTKGFGASPERLTFNLTGEVNREDYGLSFHQTVETVSIVVGKKVSLKVFVELVKSD